MDLDRSAATQLHDVFVCHASEDKDEFVRPLAEALRAHHLEVWYDEFALEVGDSLREAIDRGLAASRYGIVVLSPSFFRKRWPRRELNGLVAREMAEDRGMILPIWHHVRSQRGRGVLASPCRSSRGVSTSGMANVVGQLLKKLQPDGSPLVAARDILIEKGLSPPVVTDEWWLDIVEIKEGQFLFPDLNLEWRWNFLLPYQAGSRAASEERTSPGRHCSSNGRMMAGSGRFAS